MKRSLIPAGLLAAFVACGGLLAHAPSSEPHRYGASNQAYPIGPAGGAWFGLNPYPAPCLFGLCALPDAGSGPLCIQSNGDAGVWATCPSGGGGSSDLIAAAQVPCPVPGCNSGAFFDPSNPGACTLESTSSTTYTDLATVGPSVTITTGTSAIVWLSLGLVLDFDWQNGANTMWAAVQVSGATTIAAADVNGQGGSMRYLADGFTEPVTVWRGFVLTGLTAGSNTFTLKYRVAIAGHTGRFGMRSIAVQALGQGGGAGDGKGATVAALETYASSTFGDLATPGPSVTITTGASALVWWTTEAGKASSTYSSSTTVAVSGATTIAASDALTAIIGESTTVNSEWPEAGMFKITGLTPGANTFTVKYKCIDCTAFPPPNPYHWQRRSIYAVPL